MNHQKGIAPIVIAIIIALLAAGGGGTYYAVKKQQAKSVEMGGEIQATTTVEADKDVAKVEKESEKEVVDGKKEAEPVKAAPEAGVETRVETKTEVKTEVNIKPEIVAAPAPVVASKQPLELVSYQNKTKFFEIKYPKSYSVEDQYTCNDLGCSVTFKDIVGGGAAVNPDIAVNYDRKSGDTGDDMTSRADLPGNFIRTGIDGLRQESARIFGNNIKFDEKQVLIAGVPATLFTQDILLAGTAEQNKSWGSWKYRRHFFIERNGYFWVITIPGNDSRFDEVISGFKFLK